MAPETTVELIDLVDDTSVRLAPPTALPPEVPLEVLERNLTSHAAHIAAAEAQWLGWLGEYCARKGWAEWGCSSPVQWLSWQCGMSPSTARDKVRVALALRELPQIQSFFANGRLSYSKVRALTRVASPANDRDLAQLGVAATGSQLDVIVRSYKKARDADAAAKSAWVTRSWRGRADGQESMVYTLRVPNHDADIVSDALNAEVAATIDDAITVRTELSRSDVVKSRGGWAAMKADAAVALLNGTSRTTEVLPTDVELIVGCDHRAEDPHANDTDPEVSASAEVVADIDTVVVGGRSVAPAVGRRLCCDPRIAALIEDSRGTVLGSSRQTRLVSRRLRRALERRDRGCCRFPGCAAQRRLHAHHILHWSKGGPTELENLILVCSFHHHVVHEGGWSIDPISHAFIKPTGVVVERCPTERFRGSAHVVHSIGSFTGPAPLAEAENERFDLGLVLEGLAFNDADSLAGVHELRERWKPRTEFGPPLPADLAHERLVEAHRARSAPLYVESHDKLQTCDYT